jgi:hypothetical protein
MRMTMKGYLRDEYLMGEVATIKIGEENESEIDKKLFIQIYDYDVDQVAVEIEEFLWEDGYRIGKSGSKLQNIILLDNLVQTSDGCQESLFHLMELDPTLRHMINKISEKTVKILELFENDYLGQSLNLRSGISSTYKGLHHMMFALKNLCENNNQGFKKMMFEHAHMNRFIEITATLIEKELNENDHDVYFLTEVFNGPCRANINRLVPNPLLEQKQEKKL